MNGVSEVVEASFANEVLAAEQPVLVDFFAPWCGPCKMLAPVLEGIAKNYEGRIKVVKVNVDEAAGLATQYRIQGVPTLMIFQGGKLTETFVGLPPARILQEKLDAAVATAKGGAA
jgi:thioredoxin 1